MRRRQALLALGTAVTTALAGCNSSPTDSPDPTTDGQQPPDVDTQAKFSVESGDIVVLHEGGDILQSGQTVYVTVGGETVSETTLGEDIHVGGEIIRAADINICDYSGTELVGLYLDQGEDAIEIDTGEVSFGMGSPAPNVQIDFDYSISGSNSNLTITHSGGDTINPDNTGELTIVVDGTEHTTEVSDNSISAGDEIWSGTASDSAKVVWQHSECETTNRVIATWEAP